MQAGPYVCLLQKARGHTVGSTDNAANHAENQVQYETEKTTNQTQRSILRLPSFLNLRP